MHSPPGDESQTKIFLSSHYYIMTWGLHGDNILLCMILKNHNYFASITHLCVGEMGLGGGKD